MSEENEKLEVGKPLETQVLSHLQVMTLKPGDVLVLQVPERDDIPSYEEGEALRLSLKELVGFDVFILFTAGDVGVIRPVRSA